MRVLEAQVQISAMDKTGSAFDAVAAKASQLDKSLKNAGAGTAAAGGPAPARGSRVEPVDGRGIAVGVAAAGYAAAGAEKQFAALERRMTLLGITAEATDEQTQQMLRRAREVSMKYGAPTEGTVSAMEDLAAQGKHFQEIMDQIDPIVKTATVSGSDPVDIAKTAMTLTDSFKIPIKDLPKAFDTLYAGGLMGKFELKDMARELPGLGPMAGVRGFQGMEGLQRFIAYLETLRAGTADGSTAANQMLNILQKLDSGETNTKFSKSQAEIDNVASLDAARKSGADQIATVLENLRKATGGDPSKINTIFGDLQVLQGATTLTTMKGLFDDYLKQLQSSTGGVDKYLPKVTDDATAANTRLSNAKDTLWTKLGEKVWYGLESALKLTSPAVQGGNGSNLGPSAAGILLKPGAQADAANIDFRIRQLEARKAQIDAEAAHFQGLTANDGWLARAAHQGRADDARARSASVADEILGLLRQRAQLGPEAGAPRGGKPGEPAQPAAPVDVTGKVQLDPASKASVEVRVKVDGPGAVTGMSASGGGNLKANVGVSMAPAHTSRRDE